MSKRKVGKHENVYLGLEVVEETRAGNWSEENQQMASKVLPHRFK